MTHSNYNPKLDPKHKINYYLMLTAFSFFVSLHVRAKSEHFNRKFDTSSDFQDSTDLKKIISLDQKMTNQLTHVSHSFDLLPLKLKESDTDPPSPYDDEIIEHLSDWELKKSKEDIDIYYQWISMDSIKKTRRLRCDMIVNAPISRIISLLKSESEAGKWISGIKIYDNIGVISNNCWYSYVEFNFPWPFPNHDLILVNNLISNLQGEVIKIESQHVTGLIPEKSGIRRIPHYRGTWSFTPLPDGKTCIKFILYTKMVSNTPGWITDPILMNTIMTSFRKMRSLISHPSSVSQKLKSLMK